MGRPKIVKVVELALEEKKPPCEPEFEIVEEHVPKITGRKEAV